MPTLRIAWLMAANAALALLLSGCGRPPTAEPGGSNAIANEADAETIIADNPRLDRSALLLAIGQAASAFAVGVDDAKIQSELDGRQFSVRLPFACAGPLAKDAEAPLSMILRPNGESVEIRALPSIGIDDVTAGSKERPGTSPVTGVEGFWIDWPWILTERCPSSAQLTPVDPFMTMRAAEHDKGLPKAPPAPERTAGIAQFFTDSDSRLTSRSGRDYRRVIPIAAGQNAPKGLFLVLEGRLRQWPDGKVIRCTASEHDGRPTCIAGSTIDRVAIERADDRTLLGEWTTN